MLSWHQGHMLGVRGEPRVQDRRRNRLVILQRLAPRGLRRSRPAAPRAPIRVFERILAALKRSTGLLTVNRTTRS